MDLSRKIILASCLGAAFLAFGIGCTVEDRDIEEKDVFLCKADTDCLDGSKCVKTNSDGETVGRCVREDQIDHCVDNDNDGFMSVTEEKYSNECGFSDKNPRDPDDNNPLVYPGAAEICDGVDNNGDGCTDGTLNDKGECKKIVKPCWGAGSIENYENSVCSADLIGVQACINGSLVFARPDGKGDYKEADGACPTSTDQIKDYDDETAEGSSTKCDGKDNNCNGIIDESCQDCNTQLNAKSSQFCVVNEDIQGVEILETYIPTYCNQETSCPCVGKFACLSSDKNAAPVCANGGKEITVDSVKSESCYTPQSSN